MTTPVRSPAPNPDHIHAPWTPAQVAALNRYQARDDVHPFTGTPKEGVPPAEAETILIATSDGWVEAEGGPVVQTWAWAWMAR